MKLRELLNETIALLIKNNLEERAAYELLKECLQIPSYEMYNKLDDEIDEEIIDIYQGLIKQYLSGRALQYILGHDTFFGNEFKVNENVLIPRFETEELVENILYHIDDYFNDYEKIDIVDIGCGSGAIAISLDLEEEKANVYATDISFEALEVAKENNELLKANVTFMQGDLLQPLIDNNIKVDILVSNPPYIPDQEDVSSYVVNNEPHLALFGGVEGIDFYLRIFKDAYKVINDRSLLAFEIGYLQKPLLEKAIKEYFNDVEYQVIKDLSGKDRMLFIYINIKK